MIGVESRFQSYDQKTEFFVSRMVSDEQNRAKLGRGQAHSKKIVCTYKSINRSLEVKLIIIFYLNRVDMEITQPLGNAGSNKHDKNMDIEGSPQPISQNQVFPGLNWQQQKYDHFVLSSISSSEFNSQFYQVKSNLLVGTSISQLARAKLRTWLYEETSKLNVSRHLCGYACTYVDLYLSKGMPMKLEQFQNFGMACLLIANKLTDNVQIKIDHSVFTKKDIRFWEEKICIVLGFRLNPITYHTVLGWLVASWNKFAQENSLWVYKTDAMVQNTQSYNITAMFQILDFLALNLKSVSYGRGTLQLQVFKLVNRINFDRIKQKQSLSIEDQVLISFWSNPEEENLLKASFQTINAKFELFAKKSQSWINKISLEQQKHAGSWVKSTLSQNTQLLSRKSNEKINVNAWVQTTNESWYSSMRKILKSQKTNNHRKSSIETTV